MHRCLAWLLALGVVARAASAAGETPPPPTDAPADADKPVRRTRDASLRRIFRGPFQSSRLYTMPSTDTVGPYVLSLSGDGSLLQDPGVLTSAGVLAIGFGDLIQLEYRHTSAISITGINAPVPTAGVQLKLPIPEIKNVPAFAVALRLGLLRSEQFDTVSVEEKVTDFFFVGRLRFEFARWLTLHGGLRVSPARIAVKGDTFDPAMRRTGCTLATDLVCERTLWLPTGAYEVDMNPATKIVGEIALAPRFRYVPGSVEDPEVGYGLLGRFGIRWRVLPSVILDGSIGYQLDVAFDEPAEGPGAIVNWDIRLGAEVFVPWGALACRAAGVFCQ